jgi:hypothetical protein
VKLERIAVLVVRAHQQRADYGDLRLAGRCGGRLAYIRSRNPMVPRCMP